MSHVNLRKKIVMSSSSSQFTGAEGAEGSQCAVVERLRVNIIGHGYLSPATVTVPAITFRPMVFKLLL